MSKIATHISKDRNYFLHIGVLAILHLVGVLGFLSPWRTLFLHLTPFHLLLVFGYIFIFQTHRDSTFISFMIFVMITSYLIELVGVQTGLIFGSYTYGEALGFKVGGTPLLIGMLWFLLVYSIGSQLRTWMISPAMKAITGATMMLFIDMFIEPVAIDLGFWSWENDTIPIQNFVAWYFISFIYFLIFFKYHFAPNRIAPIIYWLQLGFFMLINLFSFLVH
jgi:bisanhydrobacterioruberin hydratase